MGENDDGKSLLKVTQDETIVKPRDGIELGHYLSWVKNELETEAACLEMPFTFVLLISFSMLALLHLKQDRTFTVEGAWKFDLQENANFAWSHNFGHKTVHDVNSIPDFWSWLRIGFLPLVVQHTWGFSEELAKSYDDIAPAMNLSPAFDANQLPGRYDLNFGPLPDEAFANVTLPIRGEYLHYNMIVAGIRLRQERSEASWSSCRVPSSMKEDLWKAWIGKPCMPAQPAYELTPEVGDAEGFNGEPARTEWLLTARDSLQELQLTALDMEDGCSQMAEKSIEGPRCRCRTCEDTAESANGSLVPGPWLDEQTQRVEIAIVAYNQNYGLISLVTVNFFFNRAGHIYKVIHVQSSWANDYFGDVIELAVMILCDVTWLLALTYIAAHEVKEIISVICRSNHPWYMAIWMEYLEFWEAVDWVSILCAYAVLGLYIRLTIHTSDTKAMMQDIAQQDQFSLTRAESERQSELMYGQVEGLVQAEADSRTSLMFYPMVVMARLFKSFDAQPRLSVVSKTLVYSSQDMLHFFIVFVSLFGCLCLNGVLLFGKESLDFATVGRSLITCFRAMLGEWDWDEMKTVGRFLAGMWITIYIIIVVVLLLNMLLAILMDAYGVVKSKASSMESLPDQITELLRRSRQTKNKERVRLNDIWDAFYDSIGDEKQMLESRRIITPDDVMKSVRGIPAKQARRTVLTARKEVDDAEAEPYSLNEVKEQIRLSVGRAKILRQEVKALRNGIESARGSDKLPDAGSPGLRESTIEVIGLVRSGLDILGGQIKEVMAAEKNIYEHRHESLDVQQREMMICAQDAKLKLQALQRQMEEVTRTIQELAAIEHTKPTPRLQRLQQEGGLMTELRSSLASVGLLKEQREPERAGRPQ
eukprot:TRINITY_DN27076_c0_g1_i1.p1 TRINITY_DN27076_c0_g1~~TRINITY_DN27076_c0_g1_i1.p1  ORF type:complete len:896 (+),score=167.46 TRINITY_DN27076_c0_g1_i1:68-2689(+)